MCNPNVDPPFEEGDLVEIVVDAPDNARDGVLGLQGKASGINWDAGHWYLNIDDPENPEDPIILTAEEVRKI